MESLAVNGPRKVLAPLQLNTPPTCDVAGIANGDASTSKSNLKIPNASHRTPSSSSRDKQSATRRKSTTNNSTDKRNAELQATSTKNDAPSLGVQAELPVVPAYPPLRTVLKNVDSSRNEHSLICGGVALERAGGKDTSSAAPSIRHVADTSHIMYVHPPSSAKPRMPSRHSSMVRLRQQQQQLKSAIEEEGGGNAAVVASVSTAEKDLSNAQQHVTTLHHGVQIFSYRPTLISSAPHSALSSSKERGSSHESPEALVDKGPKNELSRAATGFAKVLPKGLRSPSGGTELGVAPDDLEGDDTSHDSSNTYTVFHSRFAGDSYSVSQPRRSPAPRLPTEHVAPLSHQDTLKTTANRVEAATAGVTAPEMSAPFHALQFLSPCSQDHFMSPPHSARSNLGDGGDAVDSENIKTAHTLQENKNHKTKQGHEPQPAQRNEDVAVQVVVDDDELIVCPFALFGCCPRGTHTAAEMQQNAMLHYHLVAVAGCLRRMKARQQQLEENVVLLQNQVHSQTSALHKTMAQLEHFQRMYSNGKSRIEGLGKNSPASPLEQQQQQQRSLRRTGKDDRNISFPPSAANVSLSIETVESARGTENLPLRPDGDATHKALPGDVSLREPQVTDYGADGDDEEVDEGMYARQLRQRTQSAKQLYARRESPKKKGRAGENKNSPPRSATPGAASDLVPHSNQLCAVSTRPHKGNEKSDRQQKTYERSFYAPDYTGSGRRDAKFRSPRVAPTKHSSFFGFPYPYDIQLGACGSVEVSGMSNVPPYQLPNESVSTIRSASFDLYDHEDDTDVGEMRQHLLYLSREAAATSRGAKQKASAEASTLLSISTAGVQKEPVRAARDQLPLHGCNRAPNEHSACSIPSMVSVTYRPSQLAHDSAAPNAVSTVSEGPSEAALMPNPLTGFSDAKFDCQKTKDGEEALLAAEEQQRILLPVGEAVSAVSRESVRLAAPLQRPTLIRRADVAQEKADNRPPVILPRAVTATVTVAGATLPSSTLSAASHKGFPAPPMPAVGIINKAAALKPRRLSALDSEGTRVTAVDFTEVANFEQGAVSTGSAAVCSAQRTSKNNVLDHPDGPSGCGTHAATPALPTPGIHHRPSPNRSIKRTTYHERSYHVEENNGSNNNCQESHSALVVPRKKSTEKTEKEGHSKESSPSRSRREPTAAAARRPQHATSFLSCKEAGELGEVVYLGLPPRHAGE